VRKKVDKSKQAKSEMGEIQMSLKSMIRNRKIIKRRDFQVKQIEAGMNNQHQEQIIFDELVTRIIC
jgi:hypothetical protein